MSDLNDRKPAPFTLRGIGPGISHPSVAPIDRMICLGYSPNTGRAAFSVSTEKQICPAIRTWKPSPTAGILQ